MRYLKLKRPSNISCVIKSTTKSKLKIIILGEFDGKTTMKMIMSTFNRLACDNYIIAFKPHPVCPIDFENKIPEEISIIHDSVDKIIVDFNIAIVAGTTSVGMDVYYSGINVIVFIGEMELNLSPLRDVNDVQFVRNEAQLVDAIYSINNCLISSEVDRSDNIASNEYFYLDEKLPRWKSVIEGLAG
jgi:surface carbohydrate biosynthesis protein (TIGR04326 family)